MEADVATRSQAAAKIFSSPSLCQNSTSKSRPASSRRTRRLITRRSAIRSIIRCFPVLEELPGHHVDGECAASHDSLQEDSADRGKVRLPKRSYQFQTELSPNCGGGALHGVQRHARILGVQQAIERSPAGLHPLRHGRLRKTIFLHCSLDLVRQNLLERLFLARLKNAFLGQESIEGRAYFPFLLLSHFFYSTSFIRLRASSMSLAGVFCVFLMKP